MINFTTHFTEHLITYFILYATLNTCSYTTKDNDIKNVVKRWNIPGCLDQYMTSIVKTECERPTTIQGKPLPPEK